MVAGVEIVADKATRELFPPERGAAALVASLAYEAGVIVRPLTGGAIVAIAPPLTASEEELRWLVSVLRQSLDHAAEQLAVVSTVGEEEG
jgi:adenosylmethionine-8-amino-7-oxononanoate aminotransferase